MLQTLQKQRKGLIEKLGSFIETQEQLAPVAGRMLAQIILTGKKGTTFEDLLTEICASKSTISTHLNCLQNLERITYFTIPGDRKKYFTINKSSILLGIDEMLSAWETQRELHVEMKVYKESVNALNKDKEPEFDLYFHTDYIQFLDEATKSISKLRLKTITKLKQNSTLQ